MKEPIDEHARRFDDKAAAYDEGSTPAHETCVDLVVAHAAPTPDDVVLDLGTGTGALALRLADGADFVVGRDISAGMLDQAREKADRRGVENVEFGEGRFREPNVDRAVDVVVSNFAMHHLDDEAKREAIGTVVDLDPHRFVLGDIAFFDAGEPDAGFYDPAVDDPASVGTLVAALTDAGFAVTAAERVHAAAGVLVAEPRRDG